MIDWDDHLLESQEPQETAETAATDYEGEQLHHLQGIEQERQDRQPSGPGCANPVCGEVAFRRVIRPDHEAPTGFASVWYCPSCGWVQPVFRGSP